MGLSDLKRSAFGNGLRSAFSALYILTYYAFVTQMFGEFLPMTKPRSRLRLSGNADGDLELCDTLIERFLQIYPNVRLPFILLSSLDRHSSDSFRRSCVSLTVPVGHLDGALLAGQMNGKAQGNRNRNRQWNECRKETSHVRQGSFHQRAEEIRDGRVRRADGQRCWWRVEWVLKAIDVEC